MNWFARALRELPDTQREALTLAYYGGYTQREIASLTATPIGTVKTRMHRAMHILRAALDDLADLHGLVLTEYDASGRAVPSTHMDNPEPGGTDTKEGTR